jgi:hypothetical protein
MKGGASNLGCDGIVRLRKERVALDDEHLLSWDVLEPALQLFGVKDNSFISISILPRSPRAAW